MAVEQEFPLFPLGLVALPGELIPLHIFEDRYKAMIERCLEDGSEFGIVWLSDDGLKEIGCACRVEKLLEEMEDGRLNVLCRGTRPFRHVERVEHLAYPAGTLERAREAYAALVESATDEAADAEKLAGMDAYAMAATVDFGLDAKQGLLDLRSENARLRLVSRLFRAAIKRLDFIERAQARARSNGKVRFG